MDPIVKQGRPAWVEIDLDAIGHNIDIIKSNLSDGCALCGVVKADAYGHGLEKVAGLLIEKGVSTLATATVEEGLQLRRLYPQVRILVLSLVHPRQISQVLKGGLITCVSNRVYADALSEEACRQGVLAPVFAAVDTGMGRIGFLSEEEDTVCAIKELSVLPGLDFLGVLSHFGGSNDISPEGLAYTDLQSARFARLREKLLAAGVALGESTICNSFAALTRPKDHYQLCRTGAVMFGSYEDTLMPRFGFRPAMSVKALIMHIKTVPEGSYIGYNRISRTQKATRIGTLNIGYADGIPRNWSCGVGYVLVNGKKAPILGPLCMDQLMIDLSAVPQAQLYDEAVLIGESGGLRISADEMGETTGSFFDTIVTAMSLRLPYYYRKDGILTEGNETNR
ncbi:MAG: alanine racemase [Firmicutes bacterium]|nr:alanine racemase [Bacillota bacterium]